MHIIALYLKNHCKPFTQCSCQYSCSVKRNPVTFSFIASILGVYLVLLFTAVRLDRRDAVNGGVIELIDNNDKHAQKYVLEIETGMRRNAGTTAKVSIALVAMLALIRTWSRVSIT